MEKLLRIISLASIFVIEASFVSAGSNLPLGQSTQKLSLANGPQSYVNYLLYLPADYNRNAARTWPLIIFLHGSDERGDDPDLVKGNGIPAIVEDHGDFSFIVVSPQCPSDERWSPTVVKALFDEVTDSLRVDEDRVYLTGYSMGGYGTWDTAAEYPELFAAIVPIAGGGNVEKAVQMKGVPVWAFHGAKDVNVPPEESIEMVEAMKKLGGEVRLTIYPDLEHDSWTVTYNNPALYDWLLDHVRGGKARSPSTGKIGQAIQTGVRVLENTILIPLMTSLGGLF